MKLLKLFRVDGYVVADAGELRRLGAGDGLADVGQLDGQLGVVGVGVVGGGGGGDGGGCPRYTPAGIPEPEGPVPAAGRDQRGRARGAGGHVHRHVPRPLSAAARYNHQRQLPGGNFFVVFSFNELYATLVSLCI